MRSQTIPWRPVHLRSPRRWILRGSAPGRLDGRRPNRADRHRCLGMEENRNDKSTDADRTNVQQGLPVSLWRMLRVFSSAKPLNDVMYACACVPFTGMPNILPASTFEVPSKPPENANANNNANVRNSISLKGTKKLPKTLIDNIFGVTSSNLERNLNGTQTTQRVLASNREHIASALDLHKIRFCRDT